MKSLLCFLLLLFPFRPGGPILAQAIPSKQESGVYRWYVKRNNEHRQPELPSEFSFIDGNQAYYCGNREEKVLYLTFDAGYENGNVGKILDTLRDEEVPGAFFLLEHFVKRNTALVERMLSEGHLVCNHTATHKDLSSSGKEAFCAELTRMETAYREATGREISKYYRPPEGKFSVRNLVWAKEMGYSTVFWSFAYADWANEKQPDPGAAVRKIRENTHNGAVLLLHPTSATNAAILRELIDGWKAEGYRFGTLDELSVKS